MRRAGATTGEDELIRWLRRRVGVAGPDLLGDDAALLPAHGPSAVTIDHQIAGVHFPPELSPARAARRLLAINASDLAATGAVPRWALLGLAAPAGFDHRRFLDALVAACGRLGVTLAGGDLASAPRPAFVLTLIGQRTPGGRFLSRRGAQPGDRLWLGGTLGEAAAGLRLLAAGARPEPRAAALPESFRSPPALARAAVAALSRHLAPKPQLDLGRWLARRRRAAAMDVSDGLAIDLHRLCAASGVGALVRTDDLPLAPQLRRLADALGADPLELALFGGEDYVLLFALPPTVRPPLGCAAIGAITAQPGVWLVDRGGRRPLPAVGWDHLDVPAASGSAMTSVGGFARAQPSGRRDRRSRARPAPRERRGVLPA